LFVWLLGANVLWLGTGVAATLLVCSWLGLRESLRLAGITLALVMLTGVDTNPWTLAGVRFADVVIGIVCALLIQTFLWPARAGAELRQELGRDLAACSRYFRLVLDSCLNRTSTQKLLDGPRTEVEEGLQRALALVKDWQNEPMRQRPEDLVLMTFTGLVEDIAHHLLAVDLAGQGMEHDTFYQRLQAPLENLAQVTGTAFESLAKGITSRQCPAIPTNLDPALLAVDQEFERQRETRATSAYPTEEILRFCGFYFNLREVTRKLGALEALAASGPTPDSTP
jgi:uncharacterized membrane protein YccC